MGGHNRQEKINKYDFNVRFSYAESIGFGAVEIMVLVGFEPTTFRLAGGCLTTGPPDLDTVSF